MPPGPDRLYQALGLRHERGWWKTLSPRALVVDLCLLIHFNWPEGRAWPSYARIRQGTGLSKASIAEALSELEFYGLWHRRQRPGPDGPRRRTNAYTLPPDVPEVPEARYTPREKWTRPERLKQFRDGQSRALNSQQSRAVNSHRSRAVNSYRSSALDRELRIRTTQLNNEVNYVCGDADFQSPQEQDERQEQVRRYRSHWLSCGGGEDTFPGVRRALAAKLGVDEETAGHLLRHGPSLEEE